MREGSRNALILAWLLVLAGDGLIDTAAHLEIKGPIMLGGILLVWLVMRPPKGEGRL